MIVIDTPNLDAELDPKELLEFAKNLHTLAHYATCKADAILVRNAGIVGRAIEFETLCDDAYNRLPLKWRW